MGAIYKPEDAKRRRRKDRALQDLGPSIREPAKILIENINGDDVENKRRELLRSKRRKI